MKTSKSKQYYVVFLVLIIPILIFVLTYVKLSPTIIIGETILLEDLLNFFLDTYSLFISIVLAVIVFKQEQKIKFLEESEYNVFIGINSVDTRKVFGNVVFANRGTDDSVPVSKTYIGNEVSNYVCLDLSRNITTTKNYLLPLQLISKNKLLLNYVQLTKLSVLLKTKKGATISSYEKQIFETDLNNNYISFCTCDNSIISLAVGIFFDDAQIVEQFELDLYLELLDISGHIHNLQISAIIAVQDDHYFLISSKTIEL